MQIRIGVVLALGLCMSGCASGPSSPDGSAAATTARLPDNYRQMVAAHVRETFFDPYSIRDASISSPVAGVNIYGQTNTVCVRANAKNRMGAYAGIRSTAVVFNADKITTSNQEYADMICGGGSYMPFPEIEEGYRPVASGPAPAQRR